MSRAVKVLLIVVLVLAGLLVAADRIGVVVAENVAANTIKSSQELPTKPDVDIDGFPFLTQVIARDFGKITVSAADVPVSRSRDILTLDRLTVTLRDVTAPANLSSVHADTATADGTVTYTELSRRIGVSVVYAGDGRIRASKSVTIAGQTLTAQVSAAPAFVNGALSFTKTAVDGLGALGRELPAAVKELFSQQFALDGLPFNLSVNSIKVDSSGIDLSLTGRDLTYRRG